MMGRYTKLCTFSFTFNTSTYCYQSNETKAVNEYVLNELIYNRNCCSINTDLVCQVTHYESDEDLPTAQLRCGAMLMPQKHGTQHKAQTTISHTNKPCFSCFT